MQLPSTSWSHNLSQSTASGYISIFSRTDSHSLAHYSVYTFTITTILAVVTICTLAFSLKLVKSTKCHLSWSGNLRCCFFSEHDKWGLFLLWQFDCLPCGWTEKVTKVWNALRKVFGDRALSIYQWGGSKKVWLIDSCQGTKQRPNRIGRSQPKWIPSVQLSNFSLVPPPCWCHWPHRSSVAKNGVVFLQLHVCWCINNSGCAWFFLSDKTQKNFPGTTSRHEKGFCILSATEFVSYKNIFSANFVLMFFR